MQQYALAVLTLSALALLSPAPNAEAGPPYRNCADARADGAAPMKKGDPGYRKGLDRDNDGIACDQTSAPDGKSKR